MLSHGKDTGKPTASKRIGITPPLIQRCQDRGTKNNPNFPGTNSLHGSENGFTQSQGHKFSVKKFDKVAANHKNLLTKRMQSQWVKWNTSGSGKMHPIHYQLRHNQENICWLKREGKMNGKQQHLNRTCRPTAWQQGMRCQNCLNVKRFWQQTERKGDTFHFILIALTLTALPSLKQLLTHSLPVT